MSFYNIFTCVYSVGGLKSAMKLRLKLHCVLSNLIRMCCSITNRSSNYVKMKLCLKPLQL